MKTRFLLGLSLLLAGVLSCRKNNPEPVPTLVEASVRDDPNALSSVQINHVEGLITVTDLGFDPRLRKNIIPLLLQAPPEAIVTSDDLRSFEHLLGRPDQAVGIALDAVRYDNRNPFRIWVRSREQGRANQKQYRIELRAASPTRFEPLSFLPDTIVIPLKYYESFHVSLYVSHLYDGNPEGNRLLAFREGSDTPIELEIPTDNMQNSRDRLTFYFKKQTVAPGVYTVELRRADGQRAVSPTRFIVTTSE